VQTVNGQLDLKPDGWVRVRVCRSSRCTIDGESMLRVTFALTFFFSVRGGICSRYNMQQMAQESVSQMLFRG
jgi:hypothetical protein